MACNWTRLACERQLKDLDRWRGKDQPYRFDEQKAEHVVKVMELLPHIKGEWAKRGDKLRAEAWQAFILTTVFGWYRAVESDWYRRFHTSYTEVPRKNAKSTKSSAVGLYMVGPDGEAGAEVYSAATTRDQAKIIFTDSQAMARKETGFRKRYGVEVNAHNISVPSTASKFEALSAEGSSLDGLNIHCALVDELHAHKTRAVFDVLETATGSRRQSLIWLITTAGSNRAGICYEQRNYVTKILQGTVTDESYFGIIYTIDESPYTVTLQSLPAIERLEKLCTCGCVQPTQIERFWQEACARHAMTDGIGQTGSQGSRGARRTLIAQLERGVCAGPATSNGSWIETPNTKRSKSLSGLSGQGQIKKGSAGHIRDGEIRTALSNPSLTLADLQNTESQEASSTHSQESRMESAESAERFQAVYAWITATAQGLFGDYYARNATQQLAFSETLSRAYNAHSHTCAVRAATLDSGKLSVLCPADDWTEESSWIKANPNYGVSVLKDDIARLCIKAQETPSAQANFLTKRLNVWVTSDTPWMPMREWDKLADPTLEMEQFVGCECYIGIDLATVSDIAAVAYLFRRDGHSYLFVRCYLPEVTVQNSSNSQYYGWEQEKYLIATDGAATDFNRIIEDVLEACKKYDVKQIGRDPYQSTQFGQSLEAAGIKPGMCIEYGATVVNFSEPMKDILKMVLEGKIHHDGNPVLSWAMSNVVAHMDVKENIYPRKERPENKIDPVVAAIMANGMRMRNTTKPSVYATRGMRVI